eukprot:24403-Hanusia_phi.AAC.2
MHDRVRDWMPKQSTSSTLPSSFGSASSTDSCSQTAALPVALRALPAAAKHASTSRSQRGAGAEGSANQLLDFATLVHEHAT